MVTTATTTRAAPATNLVLQHALATLSVRFVFFFCRLVFCVFSFICAVLFLVLAVSLVLVFVFVLVLMFLFLLLCY